MKIITQSGFFVCESITQLRNKILDIFNLVCYGNNEINRHIIKNEGRNKMKEILKQVAAICIFFMMCMGITNVIKATQISVTISGTQEETFSNKILAHFCDFYVMNDAESPGNLYYEIREFSNIDTENFNVGSVIANGFVAPGSYQGTVNLGGTFLQHTINLNCVAMKLARAINSPKYYVVGGGILSNDDPLLRSNMMIEELHERVAALREETLAYIAEHPEEFD